jgi:6-pyruvoyltetrahydropterin/6-carboxytetrahydropterin synthase
MILLLKNVPQGAVQSNENHLSQLTKRYLYNMNKVFQSTKLIDGFSTCFRQWKATDTHCKFLHGYSISFEVIFEGELDYRNWTMDFGILKRAKYYMEVPLVGDIKNVSPDEWFKHYFDHTVVLASDDPNLEDFKVLNDEGVVRLRVLDNVGCEKFAQFVFEALNEFVHNESEGRVRVVSVKCSEHAKNSAIYKEA